MMASSSTASAGGGGGPGQQPAPPPSEVPSVNFEQLIVLKPHPPERIIFCIDLSAEVNKVDLGKSLPKPRSRLQLISQAVLAIASAKLRAARDHEFALIVLTDGPLLYMDFETDLEELKNRLSGITGMTQRFDSLPLDALFDAIKELIVSKQTKSTREAVYRAVIFYSRSDVVPSLTPTCKSRQELAQMPNFYWDCFFIHNKMTAASGPLMQQVYDVLSNAEVEGRSWSFEIAPARLQQFWVGVAGFSMYAPDRGPSTDSLVPMVLHE